MSDVRLNTLPLASELTALNEYIVSMPNDFRKLKKRSKVKAEMFSL